MYGLFAQTDGGTASGGSPYSGVVLLVVMVGAFYFLMMRPQRRRMRAHQEMIGAIAVGDEIETVAGIFGTITKMEDDVVWVEVAPGTTLRMSRGAVRRRIVEAPTELG